MDKPILMPCNGAPPATESQQRLRMTLLYSLPCWLCRIFAIGARALALTLMIWPSTHAQIYPTKPIKFIVPFSAGSATDNLARILAQSMGEAMGQPITVENKAGANVSWAQSLSNQRLQMAIHFWSPPAPHKLPTFTSIASCRMTRSKTSHPSEKLARQALS